MSTETTSSPQVLFNNLVGQVQRAGPVFTGRGAIHLEDKGYSVRLELSPSAFNQNEVGRLVQKTLGDFVRSYMKEHGWVVKSASFKKTHFELSAAPRRPFGNQR